MQHEPEGAGDSLARWSDVHTVGDFIGYLAAYDPHNLCAHGRLWTRCWSCGHYEDYLEDVDTFNDPIEQPGDGVS